MPSLLKRLKFYLDSSHLKPHLGLLVVLLIYFVLAIYAGWQTPLAEGPDEMAHFTLARFLKKEGALPFTPEEREAAGYKSSHPPLNAALIVMLFFWDDLEAPPFVKSTEGIPRRHLVVDAGIDEFNVNSPQVLPTEDPVAGELLFWHFGRLMSTIFSGLTLMVIYGIGLKTFADLPQKHLWALATVMSVAFIPTFIFISSVFNYESLLGLCLALYLLVAIHLVKNPESNWLYLLAGLCVGLAFVTKLSALPAPLGLVVSVLIVGYRAGWPKGKYLVRLALSMLGLLVGAGWWFVLVEIKLNKVAELGWIAGLIRPIVDNSGRDITSLWIVNLLSGQQGLDAAWPAPAEMLAWIQYTFATFWSWRLKGPAVLFSILLVVTGLALLGLIRVWRQKREARLWLILLLFHVVLFCILPFARFVGSKIIEEAAQGQHILFPAAGAFAILVTWGLGAWFPTRTSKQWLGGMLLGGGMLGWTIFLQTSQVYQPPLPVRTVPPVTPPSATRVELDFGPMSLRGYELKGLLDDFVCCDSTHPALGVDLYWLAKEFAVEDYLTTVSLIDDQGQRQSVWVGHAANGRYPTRAWEPGDIIRDEVWLPVIGLKPGMYTLKLEVGGAHAPLPTEDGNSGLTLTEIDVSKVPAWPNHSAKTGREPVFHLWQGGRVVDHWPVFSSRSTIQITTDQEVDLSLVGPDQIEYTPEQIAGRTHVFIVDPLWSSGLYQLQEASSDPPAWQSAPVLEVRLRQRQKQIPDSQTVVKANFADQLMLLGYDLPQRYLLPGELLPVTLHWQALQTMPTDFVMFTRLRDEAGKVWGGHDRWPREYYSPFLWVAGEVVTDGFALELSPEAPAGLYYLDVGFYLPMGEAAVSLPLVQAGQMSNMTSVTIGPFRVRAVFSAKATEDLPNPQVILNQPFGQTPDLTLLGYDLVNRADQPGPNLKLTLYWRAEAQLSLNYTTFVHLYDATGEIVAQKDQLPLNGPYPTSLWYPGEIIADEIVVYLPAEPPSGTHQLVIGMYDWQTGQRLIVPGHPANEVKLTDVKIR